MRPFGMKRLFRFSSRTREEVRGDIQEEFQFHLDMRVEELVRLGAGEEDARAQARREFGDRRSGGRECARHDHHVERRRRVALLLGEIRQDTALGVRLLARSPGFALVAVLTLALGIGANVTVFSALDAALLRPLPYPEADRLVQVFETLENGSLNSVSGGAFLDWREHQERFEAIALTSRVAYNLRAGDTSERLSGLEVSHELFDVFGITPFIGLGFSPQHDRPGGRSDVVVLTEELWRSRFNGDGSIVGRAIVLDEIPRTVIGILPRGAWMFREVQFFVPVVLASQGQAPNVGPDIARSERAGHWAEVYGRLRRGVAANEAEAQIKDVKARLNAAYPAYKQDWSVAVRPLQPLVAGDRRPALMILGGAVALVLLIACANVANLLLARACNRQQEIALRSALGATAGRVVRQVLTESAVLAVIGGLAGVALSWWGVRLVQHLTADILPRAMTPRLDARVLAFSVAITGMTGVLFGVLPAWRARRADVNDALKNGGRGATAGRHRAQGPLIVAEVAFTVVLLSGAGLLLRSLANAAGADPGFEPQRALALELSLPGATYETAGKRLAFAGELLARIRAVPGVEAAGAGMAIPFLGGGYGEYMSRTDRPETRLQSIGRVNFVSEGYLEALGTRLLAGRRLLGADNRPDASRVTVVNQTLAATFFPDGDAIGQRVTIYNEAWEIVGVIADVVDRRLDVTRRPVAYLPQAFNPFEFSIVARTAGTPTALVSSLRREIAALDRGVALADIHPLEDAMAASLAPQRLVLNFIGSFATAALGLACIGLYGVMAYTVASRRRELCIRMALGAVNGAIIRHVLRDGTRLLGIGLFIGSVAALGAARLLNSQLYQVSSYDPLVMIGTMGAVASVALVACWMPAWRATRFDPIAALRND